MRSTEFLFPPYRREIIGKKCAFDWCTDPVVVEIDINKYFDNLPSFELNIAKSQSKRKNVSLPFSIAPFEQLSGVSMDDAYISWNLDGVDIGISNPRSPQDLETKDLALGSHKLTSTVFAPIDTDLKNPLGSKTVIFNLVE